MGQTTRNGRAKKMVRATASPRSRKTLPPGGGTRALTDDEVDRLLEPPSDPNGAAGYGGLRFALAASVAFWLALAFAFLF